MQRRSSSECGFRSSLSGASPPRAATAGLASRLMSSLTSETMLCVYIMLQMENCGHSLLSITLNNWENVYGSTDHVWYRPQVLFLMNKRELFLGWICLIDTFSSKTQPRGSCFICWSSKALLLLWPCLQTRHLLFQSVVPIGSGLDKCCFPFI